MTITKAIPILAAVCLPALMPSGAFAQFVERAEESGVNHEYRSSTFFGGGVGLLDVNNDLLLDMFLVGGTQNDKLYINNGNGFTRQVLYTGPEDFGLMDQLTTGVAVGDVNNDGYDDLFLTTEKGYACQLLINRGDETFDILLPVESGLIHTDWSISAVFGDVNGDGWLDVFVANYVDSIASYLDPVTGTTIFDHTGFFNYLYINQGDGTFVERADQYGVRRDGTTLAAAFTDFDADRDADLYVVNDFGHFIIPNELYENRHPIAGFDDVSSESGADIGLFGMGVAIGDYDGDLDLDYYVTNIGRNTLLGNNGDGTFTDRTFAAGVADSVDAEGGRLVGWSTGFFDYDNDGDVDLYISNGHIPAASDIANPIYNQNALYRNRGDGVFDNVSRTQGIADPAICRGGAYGDLDGDGDLDLVFVPVSYEPSIFPPDLSKKVLLYYNGQTTNNNWVQFKLIGDPSNRNGYGAHLYLYDGQGGVQLREADGGSGHASKSTPFIHFGLGAANTVDSLVALWPSGTRQVWVNPPVNTINLLRESDGRIVTTGTAGVYQESFEVGPNPFREYVAVKPKGDAAAHGGISYRLTGVDGRVLAGGSAGQPQFQLATGHIPAGHYILQLFSRGRELARYRLIRE